jgi:hypothetical protein
MKKIATITIMLLVAITMSAQMEGKWLKKQSEADELKGSSGGTYYSYVVPGLGAFVIFDFNTYQYFLLSEKEQFNIETGYNQFAGSYAGITVLVGIYDENNKLTEKFKMWLDRSENKANRVVKTRNAGGMSNPVGQKGKVKKIFKALQSDKGYVRIVAERFHSTDFDIKIPPYKE